MNFSVKRTGITATISIILLTIIFLVSIIIYPQEKYQSASSYMNEFRITNLLPVIPGFLLVLANVPLFAALYFYATNEKRTIALTGLLFGTGYMVCSGTNYFMQLGMVVRNISESESGNIAAFLMANPGSYAYAIDNLGYLFLSVSFLAFSGVFYRRGLQSWIKAVFIIFGISGLLGALGYLLNSPLLENMVFLSAIPYLTGIILLLIEFSRLKELD
ncbi:MAG TPA: hypothetical protein VJ346_00290 [Bacteroidales bacterium]|nr:hypothetical protein [Bacteroidales bacterium]